MKHTKLPALVLTLIVLAGIGAVAYAVFTSTSHRASTLYPNVKYGSRCGPALAGSTRVDESGAPVDSLAIEQTETAPNIWTPSATPVYYMGATEGCRFDCTVGYERDGASCPASAGVSHNETG
ncbi:MAG: hypothetical protein LBU27_08050, partial [Candidatus Peribacteria bacterium]|nr:hypothetical protein [Candidatus Peribacteria bacterium]